MTTTFKYPQQSQLSRSETWGSNLSIISGTATGTTKREDPRKFCLPINSGGLLHQFPRAVFSVAIQLLRRQGLNSHRAAAAPSRSPRRRQCSCADGDHKLRHEFMHQWPLIPSLRHTFAYLMECVAYYLCHNPAGKHSCLLCLDIQSFSAGVHLSEPGGKAPTNGGHSSMLTSSIILHITRGIVLAQTLRSLQQNFGPKGNLMGALTRVFFRGVPRLRSLVKAHGEGCIDEAAT